MSYLSAFRLHFSGSFQASVSTVNNDPTHFNVAKFDPSFQKPQTPLKKLGWWNPNGDQVFRLLGCKVTAAFDATGASVPKTDPIIGALIADSNRRAPAKMVDLDPQQQLFSMIFGLEMRIGAAGGVDWLRAQFEPTAFFDLWSRTTKAAGDEQGGAAYQSVLTQLEWSPGSFSPWLDALQTRCPTGELSIKFNVDGFRQEPTSPDFCRGRIVGTIGPAEPSEPRHFVRGRQFIAEPISGGSFSLPAGKIFNCVGLLDRTTRTFRLDLGNALPTLRAGGAKINPPGQLSLVCYKATPKGNQLWPLGDIVFPTDVPQASDPTVNYLQRAGVVEVVPTTPWTDEELDAIASNPLALLSASGDGTRQIALRETPGGLYVQADESVFRLSPGERREVTVHATCFGQPYAGARVLALLDGSWLQSSPPDLPVGTPAEALQFPTEGTTDASGTISWPFLAGDPRQPRAYIDGQVYGVRFALTETLQLAMNYPFALARSITFLVWDDFPGEKELTWLGGVRDIFQLYANLYPVMARMVDLSDYDAVCQNREIIARAMALDFDDANFMPVSRDLSPAKQRAILTWLKNPVRGQPPAISPATAAKVSPDAEAPDLAPGGKAMAYARTWLRQNDGSR